MDNQQIVNRFSTYHRMFIGLLLLAFIISGSVVLKQYARNQVIVSLSRIKKCEFIENQNDSYVNIVSLIRGDKKVNLTLHKLEPLNYKDLELVESYFYRGRRLDIPTFGKIPENISRKFQQIKGAQLTPNTIYEADYVVWIFKITGSDPESPLNRKCEVKWLGLNISHIHQYRTR